MLLHGSNINSTFVLPSILTAFIKKDVYMTLLEYVNNLSFDGLPHLWVNGCEFHWNGYFWEYVGW